MFNSQLIADTILICLLSISTFRVCVNAISVRLSQCNAFEAFTSELVSLLNVLLSMSYAT